MVAINSQGAILFANKAAYTLFQWRDGELLGENVRVLPSPGLHGTGAVAAKWPFRQRRGKCIGGFPGFGGVHILRFSPGLDEPACVRLT